jgi:hypothetical protein
MLIMCFYEIDAATMTLHRYSLTLLGFSQFHQAYIELLCNMHSADFRPNPF